MRKPEQLLWDSMRDNVTTLNRITGRAVILQRVENAIDSRGIPDVYSRAASGFHTWVELKAADDPKNRLKKKILSGYGLNASQINWHAQSYLLNIRTFILVRLITSKKVFLVEGKFAESINDFTLENFESFCVAWSWEGVHKNLYDGVPK